MRRVLVAVSVLATGAAHAALPPWVYQEARAKAPLHVQIDIAKVSLPASTPGTCTVSGKVLRIFRDTPGTLSTGRVIEFPVACSRAGEMVPVGGTIWQDADTLAAARFIEVYLDIVDSRYVPALDQARIIDAPSEEPQLPVE